MAVVNSSRFTFKESVDKFIHKYLYTTVPAAAYEAIDEVSKEAVQKLRKQSPRGKTGKYAKGWTRKLEYKRVKYGAVVYGKKPETYAVAHLLEYGHVTRNGTGRTYGNVSPRVHIQPINDWALDEVVDRIISKME